jgi:hypothetical protein
MRRQVLISAGIIFVSLVLGATVFKEPIAWAKDLLDVNITNVDADGNVKVHEQGTARVFVQDVPAPAEPYHVYLLCSGPSTPGSCTAQTRQYVPEGKRFVIETMSGYATGGTDAPVTELSLTTRLGGTLGVYRMLMQPVHRNLGQFAYVNSVADVRAVRIYADSGTELHISAHADGATERGGVIAQMYLSGYLVAMP